METKQQKAGVQKITNAPVDAVANGLEAGDQKMDQIRELMFGGVVRDFERRLKELADRLEAESARMTGDYQKRISALEARLDPQIERIQALIRQETAARAGAVDDIDTRFSQALRTHRGELNAVLQRHEDESSASEARARDALSRLEDQMKQAIQAIRDSLSNTHATLQGEKLARDDLSDLMAELALRLRSAQGAGGNG